MGKEIAGYKCQLKNVSFSVLILIFISSSAQVAVPQYYYGINNWMPWKIGSLNLGGQIDSIWKNSPNEITHLGISFMRYGGTDPDRVFPI
jgi:hypothetical protein